jgi:hypothetical protein
MACHGGAAAISGACTAAAGAAAGFCRTAALALDEACIEDFCE